MREKKLLLAAVLGCIGIILSATVVAAAPFKNELPRAQWTKFGVNPWRVDTDNDGYPDAWEVKHKYCPTHPERGVGITDQRCLPGRLDFSRGRYTPPPAVAPWYPPEPRRWRSCAELQKFWRAALATTSTMSTGSATNFPVVSPADAPRPVAVIGKRLVVARPGDLLVVELAGSKVKTVARAALPAAFTPRQVLVFGNTMAVVGEGAAPEQTAVELWQFTGLKLQRLRRVEFDFGLRAAHLEGGVAYLVLQPARTFDFPNSATPTLRLPNLRDFSPSQLTSRSARPWRPLTACAAVESTNKLGHDSIVSVVALALAAPRAAPIAKTFLGWGDFVAWGPGGAVLAGRNQNGLAPGEPERTYITRLKLTGNTIAWRAAQVAPGTAVGLNEYQGWLRLLAVEKLTTTTARNRLDMFDRDLTRVGWYNSFAPGVEFTGAWWFGPWLLAEGRVATSTVWWTVDLRQPRVPAPLGQAALPGIDRVWPLTSGSLMAAGPAPGFATTSLSVSSTLSLYHWPAAGGLKLVATTTAPYSVGAIDTVIKIGDTIAIVLENQIYWYRLPDFKPVTITNF